MMRLRSQLAFGFLLLAILPLAGVVLFTYASSLGAVRRALEAEATVLAEDMDGRMAMVREDLALRLARVAPPSGITDGEGEEGFVVRVLREIAPVAPFVDSLEFRPVELAGMRSDGSDVEWREVFTQDPPPAPSEPPVAVVDRMEEGRGQPSRSATVAPVAPTPATAASPGVPPTPPVFRHPLRIDVQELVRQARVSGQPIGEEARRQLETVAAETARSSAEVAAAATMAMVFSGQFDEAAFERQIAAHVTRAEEAARVHFVAETMRERVRVAEQALAEGSAPPGAAPELGAAPGRAVLSTVDGDPGDEAVCEVEVPVREGGEVVGHVRAMVSESALRRLLSQVAVEEGDVPFAVDGKGTVHVVDDHARAALAGLELGDWGEVGAGDRRVVGDWVVATAHDGETGLTFGVARPMRGALAEVRRSAARNFGLGLGFLALTGLAVPVMSRRMSRQVGVLTEGAERIARGDLTTRLPVASGNEIGQLASAFNRMAHELSEHQVRLIEEERRRQAQEVEERLLRADHARKSAELEEARAFQLSLLPRTLPAGEGFDLAVFTRTAAEVGGDFYDFDLAADGTLTVAVGDATGHGARAGTMVAVTKSLFSSYTPEAGPAEFLGRAAQAVRRMEVGRMAMALLLARLAPAPGPRRLTVATAGMPPVLVRRAAGRRIEEVYAPGMPLGGLDAHYAETTVEVAAGDVVLLTTDGFPELADGDGEPFGYAAVRELFAAAPEDDPEAIARGLAEAVASRTGGGAPDDDVTFVVVRVR
jgi:serine phosphatase RsbU (regulator of sigma subunit)